MKERKKKLHQLNINELKKIEPILTSDVLKVFNLKYSVNSKKSYGGTSFANIKKMITKYKKIYYEKKLIISLLCLCFLLSCGKKADPEYKAKNNGSTSINI